LRVFALEVDEDFLNHLRIFDAGDDLDVASSIIAGLDVDVEYTLQALRPCYRCPSFGGC